MAPSPEPAADDELCRSAGDCCWKIGPPNAEAARADKSGRKKDCESAKRATRHQKRTLSEVYGISAGFPQWPGVQTAAGHAVDRRRPSVRSMHRLDAAERAKRKALTHRVKASDPQDRQFIREPKPPRTTAPPVRAPADRRNVPAQNGSTAADSQPATGWPSSTGPETMR